MRQKKAVDQIQSGWPDNVEHQKNLLLAELRPSMLAIVGCAIAIDALYDIIKPHVKIDPETRSSWQKNRTPRTSQVAEIFRRALVLDKGETKRLNKLVKDIFDLRDKAVHPSHNIERTMTREDIPVGLDWRFVAYRFSNAEIAYQNTMNLFVEFFTRKKRQ